MDPALKNIHYLFHPKSVAFVGATETPGKWGFIIFNNLISGGYKGDIYPINPGREEVLGFKAYPTVADIPGEVDLAVFTIPAAHMMKSIDDCVAKGVKAGMVITAGFKELGGEFADLESEMVAKARAGNMVLAGPNGMGLCCPEEKLYPWMPMFYYPPGGSVGIVSQSGNVQSMLIGGVTQSGFGISKGVSSGNEAYLHSEDYFTYMAEQEDTDVILAYLEGITDGRRFFEQSREVSKKKPIIVVKGGRTESGISAAKSHTGAMAVSDKLFQAVCRQTGIVLVDSIQDSGIVASAFINRPLPKGRRVGIVTGGGGLGVIASDICSNKGLDIVKLSEETLEKIGKLMPDWWVPGNPVDLVAGMNFQVIIPVLEILMKSGEVDSVMLLFIGPPQVKNPEQYALNDKIRQMISMWKNMSSVFDTLMEMLGKLTRDTGIPLFMVANFKDDLEDAGIKIKEIPNRVCSFSSVETACAALKAMADYAEFKGGVNNE